MVPVSFCCRHKSLMTKKLVKILCIGCWIFSYACSIIIFSIPLHSGRTQFRHYCVATNFVSVSVYYYFYTPAIIINTCAVMFMYGKMFHFLRNQRKAMLFTNSNTHQEGRNIAVQEATIKVTKLALFVIGMYQIPLSCECCPEYVYH